MRACKGISFHSVQSAGDSQHMKQHNQQQFSQFKGRAGFKAKNVELDSKSRMTASVFVVVVVVVKTTTTNPETKNIVRVWLILLLVVLTLFFLILVHCCCHNCCSCSSQKSVGPKVTLCG